MQDLSCKKGSMALICCCFSGIFCISVINFSVINLQQQTQQYISLWLRYQELNKLFELLVGNWEPSIEQDSIHTAGMYPQGDCMAINKE